MWRSLASALAWGARGRGFKSRHPDFCSAPAVRSQDRTAFFIFRIGQSTHPAAQPNPPRAARQSTATAILECRPRAASTPARSSTERAGFPGPQLAPPVPSPGPPLPRESLRQTRTLSSRGMGRGHNKHPSVAPSSSARPLRPYSTRPRSIQPENVRAHTILHAVQELNQKTIHRAVDLNECNDSSSSWNILDKRFTMNRCPFSACLSGCVHPCPNIAPRDSLVSDPDASCTHPGGEPTLQQGLFNDGRGPSARFASVSTGYGEPLAVTHSNPFCLRSSPRTGLSFLFSGAVIR